VSRSFFITTMGCQMNEYDSDFLARSLINSGFIPADDPEFADLILINTCTVRAKPEQKAFSMIGRMTQMKRRRPNLVLGVVGCMAQQLGVVLMERFPQVDLVMGPREISRFPDILELVYGEGERVVATQLDTPPPQTVPCGEYLRGRVTGYISIMEGCNNFCSYCIVPFVRGREVSRSPNDIIAEARDMVEQGIKDITLLGQNVNSYLWEGARKRDFVSLLDELNEIEGLLRLRFTTSHPKDLSDKLIQCFGNHKKLCPHIHLPFQAGSNTILKSMRRGYTREGYMELIPKLRGVTPDMAITSDVMVGFPGEAQEDYEATLDLIKRVQFDGIFSFKYSDRKGTLADSMAPKVDEQEKASRLSMLQDLQKQISLDKNRSLEGKHVEVLVEGESKKGGRLTGRTGSNKIVNFTCDNDKIGHLVNVTIERGLLNSLLGDMDPEE